MKRELRGTKRTLSLFGCSYFLKKCKRGLEHHYLCWVDVRQTSATSVDDNFTAVFPKTRHFCNVNLFLMTLIFFFYFFFF